MTITCNAGFEASGTATINCVNGKWDAAVPQCVGKDGNSLRSILNIGTGVGVVMGVPAFRQSGPGSGLPLVPSLLREFFFRKNLGFPLSLETSTSVLPPNTSTLTVKISVVGCR